MPASLPDHLLVFDHLSTTRKGGTRSVRDCVGGQVDGYLFAVKGGDWAARDHKEGYRHRRPEASNHLRHEVVVIPAPGMEVRVQTYMTAPAHRQEFVQPSKEYVEVCREGRIRLGLDTAALDAAARNAPTKLTDRVFVYGTLMRGEAGLG